MSSDGGIRLSGIASGIDTEGIIEAMLATERSKITKVEEDIELNDAKIDTWKDIASELQSFGKVLNSLKSGLSTSVYNKKKVTSADSDVLTALASNQASNASYPVKVTSLAQSEVIGLYSGYTWASNSTLGQDIEFYINDSSKITIPAGVSLDEVVSQINGATYADEDDRVSATKIKTSSSSDPDAFTLILQAKTAESNINIYADTAKTSPVAGSVYEVFTGTGPQTTGTQKNLPFFSETDFTSPSNKIRAKSSASITLFYSDMDSTEGVSLTSYTNQFSDAIQGLSINVATKGTSNIEIKTDTAEIKETITEFVSSYNDVRGILERVRDIKLDEDERFGPFFSDALLRRISSQVRSLTTGVVRMGSETSWASDGNLTVSSATPSTSEIVVGGFSADDETTLLSGDRININSIIYTLISDSTIRNKSATLTVSPAPISSPTIGTGVFLQTQTLESIGVGIRTDGVSGLDGILGVIDEGVLDQALANNLSDVEDVFRKSGDATFDTGVASRIYDWVNQQTFLSFALSSSGASLINRRAIDDVKIPSLQTSNENFKSQIKRIGDRIDQREKLLVQQFSRMESAMSQSQSVTGALGSLNQQ